MRRWVVLGMAWAVVFAALAIAPARSAPAPVAGLHAAYRGLPFTEGPKPLPVTTSYKRFFFTGAPGDQANKVLGAPTATFGPSPPAGGSSISQTGSPLTTVVEAGGTPTPPTSTLTIFWRGPYTGAIDGPFEFKWWWASANPVQLLSATATMEVSVWADPKPDGTATLIGRNNLEIPIAPTPEFSTQVLPVKGTVAHTLIVQARAVFVDNGEDVRVLYGSGTHPSGFGIPLGASPPARPKPTTVAATYNGPPLQLQAVHIGSDATEPTIGVKKDGTAFMSAGRFPFAGNETVVGAGIRPDLMRSKDGGLTWKSVQPQLPAGVAPNLPTSLDPYVYVDPSTGRVFTTELYSACTNLHFSDDDGATWKDSPLACGSVFNDHQTIVAGPPPPGLKTTNYPNVVYYCVNANGSSADCARSLDGGATWRATATSAYPAVDDAAGGVCGGLHGHIVTDAAGRLYVPKGHCEHPWLAVSEDGGDSWVRREVSSKVTAGGFQTSVAVDRDANLYYVWWDATDLLPYLAVSRDHGATWSPPRMIAPPGVREVTWPSIDVGDPGRIAVSFPGTASEVQAGGDFRPWNHYVVISSNALDADPLFVSATSNVAADPVHRGPCQTRCDGMWDFLDDVVAPSGEVWATMVDDCTGPVAGHPVNCVTKSQPSASGDTDRGVRLSAPGYAVRQVGGPLLRVSAAAVAAAPSGPAPLPATGGGGWPVAAALTGTAGVGLVALRRRARQHY